MDKKTLTSKQLQKMLQSCFKSFRQQPIMTRLTPKLEQLLKAHPAIAPTGRIKSFLYHPERKTLAPSCMLRVYEGDLRKELPALSWYLQTNAGIKINLADNCLDNWKPSSFKWWFDIGISHPDRPKMGENRGRLWDGQGVDVLIIVKDDMKSIRQSWIDFIEAAQNGATILVDLSEIRPAGRRSETAVISTGVFGLEEDDEGFLSVYIWLADYLGNPCIENLLRLFGGICKVIARGGTHKNGIITTSVNANAPFIWKYLDFPLSDVPGGSKKGVRFDKAVLEDKRLCERIVQAVNEESVFLEKIRYQHGKQLYLNVCVTGDTWVQTSDGARQVKELIGKPFLANNRGTLTASTPDGFWSNGIKPVYELESKEGYKIQLTDNHKVYKGSREGYGDYSFDWVEVRTLKPGDKLQMHNHRVSPRWTGEGNFDQGWLVGYLFGDGTLVDYNKRGHTQTTKLYFYGQKSKMAKHALEKIHKECQIYVEERGRLYTPEIREHSSNGYQYITSVGLGQTAKKFGMTLENDKNVTEKIEKASSDFYVGFLQGLFDADSHVSLGNKDGSGKSIQINQCRKESLDAIQRMLLRLGIKSTIYERPNEAVREFPNGIYNVHENWRLDITGDNITQYAALIGYSNSLKKESLDKLLASYKRQPYRDKFLSEVKSVTWVGDKEVYDCTIHEDHFFDGNGFFVHNCQAIHLEHSGSCLITPVNVAQCANPEDLVEAFCATTRFLCELHIKWREMAHNYNPELYLSVEQDRQIAVTVLGLASFLAAQGVSYEEHVEALEHVRVCGFNKNARSYFKTHEEWLNRAEELIKKYPQMPDNALRIAFCLWQAYQAAAEIARSYGLERAFSVEPTQRCYLDYTDLAGYTVSRQIDPPFSNPEGRESAVHGEDIVQYHPYVETASEVGQDLHQRHHEEWQLMMESTGLAHGTSFDLYSYVDVEWFKNFVERSPLGSTYYQQYSRVNQSYLDKGQLCIIDDPDCVVCGS